MYQLAIGIALLFPFAGLLFINVFPERSDFTTNGYDGYMPLVYYGLFLSGSVICFKRFKFQKFIVDNRKLHLVRRREGVLLFILFCLLCVIYTVYNGFQVLAGVVTKEDVRQSGFLHGTISKFIVPSIFAYLCILKKLNIVSEFIWRWAFIITFLVGFSAGGKSFVLFILLPGLTILFGGRFYSVTVIKISVGSVGLLMFTALLFDEFLDSNVYSIFNYLVRRSFVLTAETPFHVSLAYLEDKPTIIYSDTLFELFGRRFISMFISNHESYRYMFSSAITAWLYPNNLDEIISGAWNLTPNVFVEALILGGPIALPFLGWLVVYGAAFIWNKVIQMVNSGQYVNAAILSVYANMVYVSWVNSAGVMQLIHPMVIGSLFISKLCLTRFSDTGVKA